MSHTPGPLTYTAPDGKQWEVVAVRQVKADEHYVCLDGFVIRCERTISTGTYPIVRPIVPEWITPTDEHALKRPMVEVRDEEENIWLHRKLVYVKDAGDKYKFVTVTKDASQTSCGWKYCRMRNPDYKEQL